MYAVMETGGKQYRVQVGDVVFVEKLDCEADSKISIDKVVMVSDENGVKVGAPYVDGASKNEKRKMGHRQPYTQVRIDSINA